MMPHAVPVLEIGGTHVTAAAVDTTAWTVLGSVTLPLGSRTTADALLDRFAEAMTAVEVDATRWGAALPGPFDYAHGVGRYTGVGKFESLNGVDVGAALRSRLGGRASGIGFVNDADAVLLGEVATGRCAGHRRCAAITLGTGVGSAFVVDGRVVHAGPGVPPDGEVHLLTLDGVPLEDVMSRRAILRAYASAVPDGGEVDVVDIADRARGGDEVAAGVFSAALAGMCRALAPGLREFGATVLVVGGSIARSWDLVEPALRTGLAGLELELMHEPDSERAALFGAATVAS